MKNTKSDKSKKPSADSSNDDVEGFVDGIMLKFDPGDFVLARWRDGRGFIATIEKVDVSGRKVFIEYEDDTRGWADVKDIRTDIQSWDVSTCSHCLLRQAELKQMPDSERTVMEETKAKEKVHRCSDCGWLYHESCHSPPLTPEFLVTYGGPSQFVCRTCIFMSVAKVVREELEKVVRDKKVVKCESVLVKREAWFKHNSVAMAVFERSKRHLPYSLGELMWREHHVTNEQNAYCYCGGPGRWCDQMLQCGACRQWFHENCVRASVVLSSRSTNREPIGVPLLDSLRYNTWYDYTCSRCSPDGFDALERHPISWLDIVTLGMLNVSEGKAKVSIKRILVPWCKENIGNFTLAADEAAIPSTDAEWFTLLVNVIKNSPSRFVSTFSNQPNKSSSPSHSTQTSADPWCQMKTRSMVPRRLPDLKSTSTSSGQRQMRTRVRKSIGNETLEEQSNSAQEDEKQSAAVSTSLSADLKRGRPKKHSLTEKEIATEKVLKKMAGVAHYMATGVNPLNHPEIPEVNSAPFCRLMPNLHCGTLSKPLSVHIPSDSYFHFNKGEYALVQPLRYDPLTGHSVSPAISATSVSPSSSLVGAKKRKAYRPLHSKALASSRHSQGSDGVSSISSISPITMYTS